MCEDIQHIYEDIASYTETLKLWNKVVFFLMISFLYFK